jgi:hypothetical protein
MQCGLRGCGRSGEELEALLPVVMLDMLGRGLRFMGKVFVIGGVV